MKSLVLFLCVILGACTNWSGPTGAVGLIPAPTPSAPSFVQKPVIPSDKVTIALSTTVDPVETTPIIHHAIFWEKDKPTSVSDCSSPLFFSNTVWRDYQQKPFIIKGNVCKPFQIFASLDPAYIVLTCWISYDGHKMTIQNVHNTLCSLKREKDSTYLFNFNMKN